MSGNEVLINTIDPLDEADAHIVAKHLGVKGGIKSVINVGNNGSRKSEVVLIFKTKDDANRFVKNTKGMKIDGVNMASRMLDGLTTNKLYFPYDKDTMLELIPHITGGQPMGGTLTPVEGGVELRFRSVGSAKDFSRKLQRIKVGGQTIKYQPIQYGGDAGMAKQNSDDPWVAFNGYDAADKFIEKYPSLEKDKKTLTDKILSLNEESWTDLQEMEAFHDLVGLISTVDKRDVDILMPEIEAVLKAHPF